MFTSVSLTAFFQRFFWCQFLLLACYLGVRFTRPDFSTRREIRLWRSVSVMGKGLLGLASTACLVVLLKQKHSRGFKNYQMAALSLWACPFTAICERSRSLERREWASASSDIPVNKQKILQQALPSRTATALWEHPIFSCFVQSLMGKRRAYGRSAHW